MAKDGTNRGGARPGAGRPRKALIDKMTEGNSGKRPIRIMTFENAIELDGVEMPRPSEYLSDTQRDGTKLQAKEIYEKTWKWLNERNCAKLVSPQLLERYAMTSARWIHIEEQISSTGYLIKYPSVTGAVASPYVNISVKYMNQANHLWDEIFNIVRENCMGDYVTDNPQDDMMERLLRSRERR